MCESEPIHGKVTEDGDKAIQQFTDNYPNLQDVGHFYDNLTPEGYDEWAVRVNFCEPYFIVDEVVRLCSDPDSGVNPSSKHLDIGAGTGLIGYKLSQKNMTLDSFGVDASTQFVEVLKSRPYYNGAMQAWLGQNNLQEELKGKFDLLTASGVFLKGHIPADAMDDCYEALRVGGYFVTAMRECYWNPGNEEGYREKLDSYVAAGKLELLTCKDFPRGVPGEVGLFAPCQSYMVSYRKLM